MTRDTIHISISEPLRRAHVRPRLQSLADATGLPVALVGARALTIGLGHLEGDLRLIFPAAAAPTAPSLTSAGDTAPTAAPPSSPAVLYAVPLPPATLDEPPSTTATADAPPHAPEQSADTQAAPAPSMAEPPTAPRADVEPEPAPLRADPPALVTAKVVAAALGHTDAGAFHSFVFRHKELKRYSRKTGLSVLWDLGKLRAEYDRKGWKPKQARQAVARQR